MDFPLELDTATTRFAELVGRGVGDEPVPACGGWTMHDLTEHLGTIHRWAAAIVLSGQRIAIPEPLSTEPLADWYAGTAAALLSAVRCVSPEEPVPNFTRMNETAAFWPRRQMHETIVHSVDAAQALGLDESEWTVEPSIAADGVDEVLQVFFPRMTVRGKRPDIQTTIRLRATDLDQSWVIAPGSDDTATPVQRHPSLEAHASVSGTASDLYLGLWHRVGQERLEFSGAEAIAMFKGPTTP
ncbi:maleylpyruvate isomerase family mycothiol-dependent enzyme [Aeromicrobium sp. P5_D10]